MGRGRTFWLLLPESVRRLPFDLAAILVLTVLTILVATVPGVRETPLRIGFGLVFVLFIPGYALVAALFPEASTPSDAPRESPVDDSGIDGIERAALSFGLSIAIVPLIGLLLNFTPWGIRLSPILLSVGGFTSSHRPSQPSVGGRYPLRSDLPFPTGTGNVSIPSGHSSNTTRRGITNIK